MKTVFLAFFLLVTFATKAQIISQYVETDSGTTPLGIELWNNTADTLKFATNNLVIKIGTNGGTPTTIHTRAGGTLAPGAVMVFQKGLEISTYMNSQGITDVSKINVGSLAFDGNDAIIIEYGGVQTDVFGTPNSDPGTHWGTTVQTRNQNIALKSGVLTGSSGFTDPAVRFDTESTTPTASGGLSGFGMPPNQEIVWTGATDNDWHTASNWNTGTTPHYLSEVVIPSGRTNYPTTSSSVTVKSILLEPETTLIAGDSLTANVTYQQSLTSNWHLVGVPLTGAAWDDFIGNYTLALGAFVGGGLQHIGFGIYLNSFTTNRWYYLNTGDTGGSHTFTPGTGYAIKLAAAGDVEFQGDAITGDYTTTALLQNSGSGGTDFNLLANPYMAGYNSKILATDNSNIKNKTFWVWNGASYTTHNDMNPIDFAPGQGFFVEATGPSGLGVLFEEENQKHNGTFNSRETPFTELRVSVASKERKSSTQIFYAEGKTTGADYGADSKLFSDSEDSLAIFSQLVSEDVGEKLGIQSLPNTNYEELIVPLGMIAEAGKELTFSAEAFNFPSDISVYLEDKIANKFINLSEENYTITLAEKSSGIGRFFLHTTSKRLNVEAIKPTSQQINVYKSSNKEITITGLQTEKADVRIYSVLGKEMLTTTIYKNENTVVKLPIATGVYIVKVSTVFGEVAKKVML